LNKLIEQLQSELESEQAKQQAKLDIKQEVKQETNSPWFVGCFTPLSQVCSEPARATDASCMPRWSLPLLLSQEQSLQLHDGLVVLPQAMVPCADLVATLKTKKKLSWHPIFNDEINNVAPSAPPWRRQAALEKVSSGSIAKEIRAHIGELSKAVFGCGSTVTEVKVLD
jgi:hypothetical protein